MQGKVCGKKRHTKTEIRSEISELICGRIAAGENYNLTRDRSPFFGYENRCKIDMFYFLWIKFKESKLKQKMNNM